MDIQSRLKIYKNMIFVKDNKRQHNKHNIARMHLVVKQ